jgi:hypothetical protein
VRDGDRERERRRGERVENDDDGVIDDDDGVIDDDDGVIDDDDGVIDDDDGVSATDGDGSDMSAATSSRLVFKNLYTDSISDMPVRSSKRAINAVLLSSESHRRSLVLKPISFAHHCIVVLVTSDVMNDGR